MKRILLIGNSPLPEENAAVRPAAGLRTWQFLKGLERAGGVNGQNNRLGSAPGRTFQIRLVTIDMPECREGYGKLESRQDNCMTNRGGDAYTDTDTDATNARDNFTISKDDPDLIPKLQNLHDEFHPDVIISVNTYPSYLAAGLRHASRHRVGSLAPLWADLNGWIMAEAQAQAYKMDSNDYIGHYFEMEKKVIGAADKFSAVSKAECSALYGELAWAGRLNKESFGYKFVEHVPNGTEWFEGEKNISSDSDTHVPGNADQQIPKNSFVLLWVGGYNTWVDEFTLFKGVSEAMRKCSQLFFVSTGGALGGLDNKTFEKFKKMIEKSELKSRFIFPGWVETSRMPSMYAQAEAGINVDRRCVETMTGARNRINEMMKFGLPVITTLGSEIAGEVVAAGAGLGVVGGDHAGLAGAITSMYEAWRGGGGRENAEFRAYAKNGRKYVAERCNYDVTLAPLLDWLENPRPAPDRNVNVGFGDAGGTGFAKRGVIKMRMFCRYLRENGFKKSFRKFLQKIKR